MPVLQLLGDGLDAIFAPAHQPRAMWERLLGLPPQRDDRWLIPAPAQKRLDRYYTAAQLHPLHKDPIKAQLRLDMGELFRRAWIEGRRPRLMRIQEQMPAIKQRRRHLRAVSN